MFPTRRSNPTDSSCNDKLDNIDYTDNMISEVVDNTDTETMGPMLNTTHVSSGASNHGHSH